MESKTVDVRKMALRYIVQTVMLVIALAVLAVVSLRIAAVPEVLPVVLVSSIFVLMVESVLALVWRWVALKHRDMLTSFFTGASGLRFLGALAVMFVWLLLCDRAESIAFICVFMLFYLVSLLHNSIFFSKVTERL